MLQNNNTVITHEYILKLSRMDTHKQIKVAIKFYPIKIFFWGAFCFDFSLDFGLQCTLLVSPVYRDRLRWGQLQHKAKLKTITDTEK